MLKQLAEKHHLVLKHGQNLRIISQLSLNYILLAKLRIHKWLHGIHHPIVHYYAVCWNEERILPFMFDHYCSFVNQFIIYDNYSNDNSISIIKQHPNTKIIQFGGNDEFNDNDNRNIKNNCWKRSRGKADWIIVCDMDEFLYHPNMEDYIQELTHEGVTLPTTEGYEMYSKTLPNHTRDILLTEIVQQGVRSHWLNKSIVFDPHRIVDINYSVGAHQADPTGIVRRSTGNPLKVLHYKHLGLDYLMERYRKLGKRLSAYNLKNQYGTHYLAKEEELRVEMAQGLSDAQNVVIKQ